MSSPVTRPDTWSLIANQRGCAARFPTAGTSARCPLGDFNLDASSYGKRFLAVRRAGGRSHAIFYVENWAADLPAGK